MGIYGNIEQLTSKTQKENAFLNLESKFSGVECWSNFHGSPTYLWIHEETWGIIVFETVNDEKQWLQDAEYLSLSPTKIFKLVGDGLELIYQLN